MEIENVEFINVYVYLFMRRASIFQLHPRQATVAEKDKRLCQVALRVF